MTKSAEMICKFCHNTLSEEETCYRPCKCTGSLKYIHEDCLKEWVQRSNNKKCELCNHIYKYKPVYRKKLTFKMSTKKAFFIFLKFILLTIKNVGIILFIFALLFGLGEGFKILLEGNWQKHTSFFIACFLCFCVFAIISFLSILQKRYRENKNVRIRYDRSLHTVTNDILSRNETSSQGTNFQSMNSLVREIETEINNLEAINDYQDLSSTEEIYTTSDISDNDIADLDSGEERTNYIIRQTSNDSRRNPNNINQPIHNVINYNSVINLPVGNQTPLFDEHGEIVQAWNQRFPQDIDGRNATGLNVVQRRINENGITDFNLPNLNFINDLGQAPRENRWSFRKIEYYFDETRKMIYSEFFLFFNLKNILLLCNRIIFCWFICILVLMMIIIMPLKLGCFIIQRFNYNSELTYFMKEMNVFSFYKDLFSIFLGYLIYFVLIYVFRKILYFHTKTKKDLLELEAYLNVLWYFFTLIDLGFFTLGTVIHFLLFKYTNLALMLLNNENSFISFFKNFYIVCYELIKLKDNFFESQNIENLCILHPKNYLILVASYILPESIIMIIFHYLLGMIIVFFACIFYNQMENAFRCGVFYFYETNIFRNNFDIRLRLTDSFLMQVYRISSLSFLFYTICYTFIFLLNITTTDLTFNIYEIEKLIFYYFFAETICKNMDAIRSIFCNLIKSFNILICYVLNIDNYFFGKIRNKGANERLQWCPNRNKKYSRKEKKIQNCEIYLKKEKVKKSNRRNHERRFKTFNIPRFFNLRCIVIIIINLILSFYFVFIFLKSSYYMGKSLQSGFKYFDNYFAYITLENSEITNDFKRNISREAKSVEYGNKEVDNLKNEADIEIDNIINRNEIEIKDVKRGKNDDNILNYDDEHNVRHEVINIYSDNNLHAADKGSKDHEIDKDGLKEKKIYAKKQNKITKQNKDKPKTKNKNSNENKKLNKQNTININNIKMDDNFFKAFFGKNNYNDVFFLIGIICALKIVEFVIVLSKKVLNIEDHINLNFFIYDCAIFIVQKIIWTLLLTLYVQVFVDKILDDDDVIKIIFISYNLMIGFIASSFYMKACVFSNIIPRHFSRRNKLIASLRVTYILSVIILTPYLMDLALRKFISRSYRAVFYCLLCFVPFGVPLLYIGIKSCCLNLFSIYSRIYDYFYLVERKIDNYSVDNE
ncbi:hypothetical protein COBT_001192 [Conglomerata obtusa]